MTIQYLVSKFESINVVDKIQNTQTIYFVPHCIDSIPSIYHLFPLSRWMMMMMMIITMSRKPKFNYNMCLRKIEIFLYWTIECLVTKYNVLRIEIQKKSSYTKRTFHLDPRSFIYYRGRCKR